MKTYPYAILGMSGLYILLRGSLTVSTFLEGVFFGTIIVFVGHALIQPQIPENFPKVIRRFPAWLAYVASFALNAVRGTVDVVFRVFSPGLRIYPGILAVSLARMSDLEIAMLANSITLTPGTIVIDVSDEGRIMYVHAIDTRDVDRLVSSLKGMEAHVMRVFQ